MTRLERTHNNVGHKGEGRVQQGVPKGDDQHGRSSLLLLVLVLHLVAPFLLLLPALDALLDPPRTTTTTFGSDLEAPRWVPAASAGGRPSLVATAPGNQGGPLLACSGMGTSGREAQRDLGRRRCEEERGEVGVGSVEGVGGVGEEGEVRREGEGRREVRARDGGREVELERGGEAARARSSAWRVQEEGGRVRRGRGEEDNMGAEERRVQMRETRSVSRSTDDGTASSSRGGRGG